ncbi:MAG: PH domain-containing protein [Chloroflexi bacterium]|nr:PH domain-containing protein [Chloroflexota bacterium]
MSKVEILPPGASVVEKEKILFEIKPVLLPTILNMENIIIIGFVIIAVIASVAFRVGLSEFLIIAALFLLLAVPSFRRIFIAGSTTYVLTNYRLGIFTVGFGQKERFIPLEHIQTVVTRSSFLQRFYGAGDIVIKLKGLRGSVTMIGLMECKRRAEQIRKAAMKVQAAR